MNSPSGFLWYRKEENQFYLNQTQTPDGWAPLPVSVNPKDINKQDLEDLAEALSIGSQYSIYVDKESPYASDAKDNRGQSSLRPFRTLERALLEAARRSFRRGGGSNDITDRVSIFLASGTYDVNNGYGGQVVSLDYNRRQDASRLLYLNKTYLIERAYNHFQDNPVFELSLTSSEVTEVKRDLGYFVDAIIDDISGGSNINSINAAKALINLAITSEIQYTAAYAEANKRSSIHEAINKLITDSQSVIKNEAEINATPPGIRDLTITQDSSNLANPCQAVQNTIEVLYQIIQTTLDGSVDPRTIAVNPGERIDTANFPTEGEPTAEELSSFNSSSHPGIILPRGVSIIGADLRKVFIRPKYVPRAHDSNDERCGIFRMTGGNFFSGFTVMDKPGLHESHHKLSCFEFSTKADLESYYNKVALAFEDSSLFNRLQDASSLLRGNIAWIQRRVHQGTIPGTETQTKYLNIFEAEIPSILSAVMTGYTTPGNRQIVEYANRFTRFHINQLPNATVKQEAITYYSSLFERLTYYIREAISNRANEAEGGFRDDRILPDLSNPYNPCQDVHSITSTLISIITTTMSGTQIPVVNYTEWTTSDVSATDSEYRIVGEFAQNPVQGASPYIYSASLRSRWGMCGIDADGSNVEGFKSFVCAQFTVISMQSDTACFKTFEPNEDSEGEVEKRYLGTRPEDPVDYRHFGYRVSNGAYAQLVSCFCIAPANHYWCSSGAEFSITNSTSNFGDVSLYAEGFLGEGDNTGAYAQDRGHKLIAVKKPKDVDLTTRTFVIGYLSTTELTNSGNQTGTITLTGTINTHNYTIDDSEFPTRIYARIRVPSDNPNNLAPIISADVISHTTDSNGVTTLTVTFNDDDIGTGNQDVAYSRNWIADDTDPNYRRGLIGTSLYFERYVDTRSYDDHFYKLVIEKAESTTTKKREPVVNYILRKDDLNGASQPFNGAWDDTLQRGNLYYLNDLKEHTELTAPSGKTYYEMIMLSAYSNPRRQMEYYEDAIATSVLDKELDKDPRYNPSTERADNVTLRATKHIIDLLDIPSFVWSDVVNAQQRVVSIPAVNQPTLAFNKPSIIRCAGQTWEYVGYYNYDTAIPAVQPKKLGEGLSPLRVEQLRISKTQTQVQGGRIYATGMDEEGATYAGNRITDLKTGQQRSINLGTSPQIEESDLIVSDYPLLTARELVVTETATIESATIQDLTATNATFPSLTINPDLSDSTSFKLTIERSDEQDGDLTLTFPSEQGQENEVLTNDGTGELFWSKSIIIQSARPLTNSSGNELLPGQLWLDPTSFNLYLYYQSTFSTQWIQVNEGMLQGEEIIPTPVSASDSRLVITSGTTALFPGGGDINVPAYIITSTNPNNRFLSYKLQGKDVSLFRLSGDSVYFRNTPQFRSGTSSNNDYTIEVAVSDGVIDSFWHKVMITIQDPAITNYPPDITSSRFVYYPVANGAGVVYTIPASDKDNDTLTYSIVSGNWNNVLEINGRTISFVQEPELGQYKITIRVSDGVVAVDRDLYILVVDTVSLITSPFSSTHFLQDLGNSLAVYTVTVEDADNKEIIYSIDNANDSYLFNINPTSGVVSFRTMPSVGTYTIKVRATESSGDTYSQTVTINVI